MSSGSRWWSLGPTLGGPIAGLVIALPIVALGFLLHGRLVLPLTVPVLDTAAIGCLLLTAAVAGLEAWLRADRRAIPAVAIGTALAALWIAHLVLFPGGNPALNQRYASIAASSVFVTINLTTPLLLSIALLWSGGRLESPSRWVGLALAVGLVVGGAVLAIALYLAPIFPTITAAGQFNDTERWVGGAGLVPAIFGMAVFLTGRRGDVRTSGGFAAALVISGCNSIVLFVLDERYTPAWYADHLLAFAPTAALLAGQLALLAGALRREQRSAASLRTSLDMAEAMASQLELNSLIERLMAGAMAAVQADRATLMAIEGTELRIEASIDRSGTPARPGTRLPVTSLQVDGVSIVTEAIRGKQALATAAYDRSLLAAEHGAGVLGVKHYITWPLLLGGEVDAVLFLGRRVDRAFDGEDATLLTEFATIAALLLRNARLLRAAEAANLAKGTFLNLAAHELRTPLSVIRGYLAMLSGGDLGPIAEGQGAALRTLEAKADELSEQVDQILIAARLDGRSGEPTSDLMTFDLAAAAHEAVERLRARATLVGATVELVASGEVPVRGSPSEIGLVLDNLLNNALTYSRPPPEVRIEVAAEGPLVRVVDRGVGILPQEQERVFERFYRVDRPDFAYPAGTGLGLSISRRMAEASGGTLELEWSRYNVGSSFLLKLPAASGLDEAESPSP